MRYKLFTILQLVCMKHKDSFELLSLSSVFKFEVHTLQDPVLIDFKFV